MANIALSIAVANDDCILTYSSHRFVILSLYRSPCPSHTTHHPPPRPIRSPETSADTEETRQRTPCNQRKGLRSLVLARDEVAQLKEQLKSLDRKEASQGGETEAPARIGQVSKIARQIAQTVEIVTQLREITFTVTRIADIFGSDISSAYGPCPHLLEVHAQLLRLTAFRAEAIHDARPADRLVLLDLFKALDELVKKFEDWLFGAVVAEVVEWVRRGRGGVVVRVWKIVEVEGKEDEKAVAIRLVKKVAGGSDAATRHRSMQAAARVIKNWRHKLLDTLSTSIATKFNDHRAATSGDDVAYLDGLERWMYGDLLVVQDELSKLVPPDYNIVEFWTKAVHRNVDTALKAIATSEPEARVLLRMHGWIKEYRSSMKQLGIPSDGLQPPLLDGKHQDLIEDYVLLIVEKIDKWTVNLMHSETQDFTARKGQPEVNEQGLCGLSYAVILWEMMNQQVDLAADSGQGAVLARVVGEGCKVLLGTLNHWAQLLNREYKRFTDPASPADSQPPVPVGLEDYVMALTHDMLKVCRCREEHVDPTRTARQCEIQHRHFHRVERSDRRICRPRKEMRRRPCRVDLFRSAERVQQLFTNTWYCQNLVESMVATMGDYMADYEARLNPSLRELLVQDLAVEWLALYLNALRRVPSRGLQMPAARERMAWDIDCVTRFFQELKPPSTTVPSSNPPEEDPDATPPSASGLGTDDMSILTLTHSILSATPQMIFMDYWAFATSYGPQFGFIEALLRGRDDLDKQTVAEVMDGLRRKIREEGVEEPAEATIMVKVKNSEEGLLANLKGKAAALGATTYSALRS
ncbi:SNARE-binding exocyst subunit S6 [Naganishia albida]|nr:SNARE-binding exocyst subunit S6 [Naganishia albida]